jgi:DNA-nicking Smr family endonuclease
MSSKDDEKRLFEEAMKGVRRLSRKTGPALVPLAGPPPPPRRMTRSAPALAVVSREGEHYLLLAPDGARPHQPPEGQLDLHGHHGEQARAALRSFIATARERRWQRVLVIHGRGRRSGPEGPVLRDCVLDALLAPPLAQLVLAVTNAPAALGGLGAALIALRLSSSGRRPGSG